MLDFDPSHKIEPRLLADDLEQFRELDRVAEALNSHDVVEYWKSAPFPLNFMVPPVATPLVRLTTFAPPVV